MVVLEKLDHATQLMYQGNLKASLETIAELEKSSTLTVEDQFKCQLLKCKVHIKAGTYQQALNLAQNVFNEAEQHKQHTFMVDALIIQIETLWRIGKLSESEKLLTQAEKLITTENMSSRDFSSRIASLEYHKGVLYSHKGEGELALESAKKSLAIREDLGETYNIGTSLNLIANSIGKEEKEKAFEYYQKALDIFEEIGDIQFITFVRSNMISFYQMKGELDQALELCNQNLVNYQKLGNKQFIGWGLDKLGHIYHAKGELDKALAYLQKSLAIYKEMNFGHDTASAYKSIAYVYQDLGKLNLSLEYYQKALKVYEELDMKTGVAYIMREIGKVYVSKGELNLALEQYQSSFKIFKEAGTKETWAESFTYIGEVYHMKGKYDIASSYYQKSLNASPAENKKVFPLYKLIKLCIDSNTPEQAQSYLEQLQEIQTQFPDNKTISQFYRVSQGMVLKTHNRTIPRAKAQELFQQVAEEKTINHELTIQAILNLSELLLDELRMTGNEEILREVKDWSNKLMVSAQAQNSSSLLVETYLLQSTLALLELDLDHAEELLAQAKMLSEEKGLGQLAMKSSTEYESLVNKMGKWRELIDQKLSLNERVQLTELDNLLSRMKHKKGYFQEIIEYAREAQEFVDDWTKK